MGLFVNIDSLDLGNLVVKKYGFEIYEKGEVCYRKMSNDEYQRLKSNEKLIPTKGSKSEMFVSPTKSYTRRFEGILVMFVLQKGTLAMLEKNGLRDESKLCKSEFCQMKPVSKGWRYKEYSFYKSEDNQINIGLGQNYTGGCLKLFNENIIACSELG